MYTAKSLSLETMASAVLIMINLAIIGSACFSATTMEMGAASELIAVLLTSSLNTSTKSNGNELLAFFSLERATLSRSSTVPTSGGLLCFKQRKVFDVHSKQQSLPSLYLQL